MEADFRHGDYEWVLELRISKVGDQPKPPHPDIQDILDRYPTVFGDILLGGLPERGF